MPDLDPIPILCDDLNRILLVGELADPPEVRVLNEHTAVCFLRLNCLLRQSVGPVRELDPCYVNVLVLGGYALKIARYLYAERYVVVDGSLRSTRWETPDARKREELCVLARRVEFLGPPPWEFERARAQLDRPGEVWRSSGSGGVLVRGECSVGFSEDVWI
ncbi:MAG TPA: single-stranded DNA-binding protein [Solirubrobacteraceae bacterium]|jgi:single-stranded DNA-binding protein|nr:single-stranded DNA-binding protein [Solirubrobacteraceae bacterium]